MAARRDESAAVADSLTADAAVDVAQAAELSGLSKSAIRARIGRHQLASELRDGRHYVPVVELVRRDLLIAGARYTSLRERAESLDAQLHDALESRDHLQEELDEAQAKVRMVWGMARQSDQKLSRARKRRWGIRWPFRRSAAGH
jgi:chromosome segregation ATPase